MDVINKILVTMAPNNVEYIDQYEIHTFVLETDDYTHYIKAIHYPANCIGKNGNRYGVVSHDIKHECGDKECMEGYAKAIQAIMEA